MICRVCLGTGTVCRGLHLADCLCCDGEGRLRLQDERRLEPLDREALDALYAELGGEAGSA